MFSSVSALKIGFRMIPFEEFKLLCSVTSTGTPKKEVCFFKFSVWVFLVVSTSNVPFYNFFTDFAVPIIDSICFSITKGESEVTGFSLFLDSMIKYLAKFSCEVKIVEASCSSSSESGLSRLSVEDAIVKFLCLDSYALHPPWSPTRGRLSETDLQFPAPKLHNYHTRRARSQSNSDHLRFTTNIYYFRCLKKKKEITYTGSPHHANSLPLLSNHRKTTKYKPVD